MISLRTSKPTLHQAKTVSCLLLHSISFHSL